ncbi:Arc family DNA-binding protein [Grimontia kaedaensis]|uniref:Arc family DNA-binding protein n=1 Tax=Grimontia kaedaensis TaxID=2872157 RepID=A0ABY4WPH2_9GAMM|nr:Arc family DNA-binding protein [Grimontia kaedaensis]USH01077.1 Arc family DNA-binding protein [Grimontia kaedaensis]
MTEEKTMQFKIRIGEELHKKVKTSAEQAHNSLNTEILERLGATIKIDEFLERKGEPYRYDTVIEMHSRLEEALKSTADALARTEETLDSKLEQMESNLLEKIAALVEKKS